MATFWSWYGRDFVSKMSSQFGLNCSLLGQQVYVAQEIQQLMISEGKICCQDLQNHETTPAGVARDLLSLRNESPVQKKCELSEASRFDRHTPRANAGPREVSFLGR